MTIRPDYHKRWREKMRSLGNCPTCGKPNTDLEFDTCLSCRRKRWVVDRKPHAGYAKTEVVNGIPHKQCKKCNVLRPLTEEFWLRCRGKLTSPCRKCKSLKATNQYRTDALFRRKTLIKRKEAHRKDRLYCLTEYSGGSLRCACCGEDHYEFLTIDHIDGEGAAHRREVSGGRACSIYGWLVRNNFPLGFRVLCFNCNCARSTCGYCPHETDLERRRNVQRRDAELCLHGTSNRDGQEEVDVRGRMQ